MTDTKTTVTLDQQDLDTVVDAAVTAATADLEVGGIDWGRKLTSRKFWVAIATLVSLLVVALGGSEQASVQITAIIMAVADVFGYLLAEGLVDAAGAKAKAEASRESLAVFGDDGEAA